METAESIARLTWWEFFTKNKAQVNAIFPAVLLNLACGLYMSFSILNAEAYRFSHRILVLGDFFIGAVVGSIVAPFLLRIFWKRHLYIAVAGLLAVASILSIAVTRNEWSTGVAQILAGGGYGMLAVIGPVHAGEVAVARLRGFVVAYLHAGVTAGLVLGALCGFFPFNSFYVEPTRVIGSIGLIFTAFGAVGCWYFCVESPVWMLRRENEAKARELMNDLRGNKHESWSVKNDIQEIKLMILEDFQAHYNIFADKNWRPLLVVTLVRLFFVASFNFPFNNVRMNAINGSIIQQGRFGALILSLIRFLISIPVMFTMDRLGRIFHLRITAIGGAIFALIAATFMIFDQGGASPTISIWYIFTSYILYELFASYGLATVGDIYSAEAFSLVKKSYSIAFGVALENLVQFVLIVWTKDSGFYWEDSLATAFTCGGFLLIFAALTLTNYLPETANMSIRQSRMEFSRPSGMILYTGTKETPGIMYS